MRFIKNNIWIILIGLTLLTASCTKKTDDQKPVSDDKTSQSDAPKVVAQVYPLISAEAPKNNMAADFVWDQNGKQVRFSEFTKGKFVLLNFWGTWCPPCRRELPDLEQIAAEIGNKNLVVIGVAMERTNSMTEALSGVSTFWVTNQMNYPVIIGTGDLFDAYGGIEAVPTTFMIDDKGKIVNSIQGARTKAEFDIELNKMMK
jgi:thiol-disulfide isomerase/thioredoxin